MEKILILYSGGADSRLLLQMATDKVGRENVGALTLSYGQLMPEIDMAIKTLKKEGIDHWIRRMPRSPSRLTHPSMPVTISWEKVAERSVSEAWVPGRNLIMASIALSMAEAKGYGTVWMGCDASDQDEFPDCTPTFVALVHDLAQKTYSRGLSFNAPLLPLLKEEIIRELSLRGISEEEYVSGYPSTPLEDS